MKGTSHCKIWHVTDDKVKKYLLSKCHFEYLYETCHQITQLIKCLWYDVRCLPLIVSLTPLVFGRWGIAGAPKEPDMNGRLRAAEDGRWFVVYVVHSHLKHYYRAVVWFNMRRSLCCRKETRKAETLCGIWWENVVVFFKSERTYLLEKSAGLWSTLWRTPILFLSEKPVIRCWGSSF